MSGASSNNSAGYYQLEKEDLDSNVEMLHCQGKSTNTNGNGRQNNSGRIQAGAGKFDSENLLTVPLRTDDTNRSVSGALYKFTPRYHHSALTLSISTDAHMIRRTLYRSSLIVVTDQSRPGTWFAHHQGVSGWINVTQEMLDAKVLERVTSCHPYEDWQGKNYFLCNGKIILGSDAKFFL